MIRSLLLSCLILSFITCNENVNKEVIQPDVFVVVLGIAQDAGYPQAGCNKSCCEPVWKGEVRKEKVVSLGVVDLPNNKVWLFDATPDFKEQLQELLSYLPEPNINSLAGIFLTHAHIGHYTGLMQLGHEAMGASQVPVYVMPKMKAYLENNGPWGQLVSYENIKLLPLQNDSTFSLTQDLALTPMKVPHRDEYSETVGYHVKSRKSSFLFIPDINKWSVWDKDIVAEVSQVDHAFLDGSFYSGRELPNRDMSEIPHPFVPETISRFSQSPDSIKNKVVFIHFNHTNPLIHDNSEASTVRESGYRIAREGDIFTLN
jgi:pyrroloquinoline quinone biosynthesis protein B